MVKKDLAQLYRSQAQTHLERAKKLLASENVELSFLCLKLRQCVEALSYGLLATYRHELSKSAMMSWTPRKVLDELEAADPVANASHTIEMGFLTPEGKSETLISGEDRRFTPKWANKAYNKLSNILHVPTPKMLEGNGELPAEEIRRQCEEYIALLDGIFATPLWHFISGRFAEVTCDCGFLIKRRAETVNVGSPFECAECGRIYDVVSLEEGTIETNLRKARWTCVDCKSDNELGAHELGARKSIAGVVKQRARSEEPGFFRDQGDRLFVQLAFRKMLRISAHVNFGFGLFSMTRSPAREIDRTRELLHAWRDLDRERANVVGAPASNSHARRLATAPTA
jgi:hypothetical protein